MYVGVLKNMQELSKSQSFNDKKVRTTDLDHVQDFQYIYIFFFMHVAALLPNQ